MEIGIVTSGIIALITDHIAFAVDIEIAVIQGTTVDITVDIIPGVGIVGGSRLKSVL